MSAIQRRYILKLVRGPVLDLIPAGFPPSGIAVVVAAVVVVVVVVVVVGTVVVVVSVMVVAAEEVVGFVIAFVIAKSIEPPNSLKIIIGPVWARHTRSSLGQSPLGFYLLAFSISSMTHSMKVATLEYTPGNSFLAQPFPKLTIPARANRLTRGGCNGKVKACHVTSPLTSETREA